MEHARSTPEHLGKPPEHSRNKLKQESPMGILTGLSDPPPPHPHVNKCKDDPVAQLTNLNRRDKKCDCETQYFDYSVTK